VITEYGFKDYPRALCSVIIHVVCCTHIAHGNHNAIYIVHCELKTVCKLTERQASLTDFVVFQFIDNMAISPAAKVCCRPARRATAALAFAPGCRTVADISKIARTTVTHTHVYCTVSRIAIVVTVRIYIDMY